MVEPIEEAEVLTQDLSTERPRTILIVGRFAVDALEGSYSRAFQAIGCKVCHFDMPRALDEHKRLGKIGQLAQSFLTVEPWMAKANRQLFLAVMDLRPDIVIIGGTHKVMAGTLAQIKSSLPGCALVLVWPDALLNCYSHSLAAIPVYDLIASYSQASVEPFCRLGARHVAWVPLGFDPELHRIENRKAESDEFTKCDASFVGNYTTERESVVNRLVEDGFRIKVWGPEDWERTAKNRGLFKKYFQGRPLWGEEFCLAIRSAPVSLNPINPLNFPAANMRFFEIPGCGGTALSAACPEMEPQFPDGQRAFYYDKEADVTGALGRLIGDQELRERVRKSAHELVLAKHTYRHRALQILSVLTDEPGDPHKVPTRRDRSTTSLGAESR